jgi:Rrf2 family protein
MLKLSREIDYGLIILLTFSEQGRGTLISAAEMADLCGLPTQQVAKLLKKFQKSNVVESVRGPKGGYRLLADPSQLNFTAIFESLGSPLELTSCSLPTAQESCALDHHCRLQPHIFAINSVLKAVFSSITLKSIQDKRLPVETLLSIGV